MYVDSADSASLYHFPPGRAIFAVREVIAARDAHLDPAAKRLAERAMPRWARSRGAMGQAASQVCPAGQASAAAWLAVRRHVAPLRTLLAALLVVAACASPAGPTDVSSGTLEAAPPKQEVSSENAQAETAPEVGPEIPDLPSQADPAALPELATEAAAEVVSPEPWEPVPDYAPDGPLCDIPQGYVEAGGDPVHIPCQFGAERFSDADPALAPATLRIAAWNVRFGIESAAILETLQTAPELAGSHVLLLSEVSRRDQASGPPGLDQPRELAQALAMDYVFGVEWDRRLHPDEGGEHGVAVLSKYPLGNPNLIRHVPQNDWWKEAERYGGRVTLGVDALIAGKRVRFYASHLDTRGLPEGRAAQGAEIRADADLAGRPLVQVVGGDLNTWTCNPLIADCTKPPAAEPVVQDFLAAGWSDGTEGFKGHTQLGKGIFPQRLDWLFHRGSTAQPGTALLDADGSDHFPLFFALDSAI